MQIRKKHLLGFVGLAVVAVMTVVAIALPNDDASAVGGNASVNIKVTVVDPGEYTLSISEPKSGQLQTGDKVKTAVVLNNVYGVKQYLYKINSDGTRGKRYDLPDIQQSSGTYEGEIDMSIVDGYGTYEYVVEGISAGVAVAPDSVKFEYRAASLTSDGETDKNENPIVNISVNGTVERGEIQVYDAAGKPMFVNAEGKEEPVTFTRGDIDANGHLKLMLPFKKYGLKPGTYTVFMTAYNRNGDTVSMNTVEIKYAPKNIDVPDAGSLIFGNLNISRIDYLLTGIIAFGAVAGFAIYLIYRKNRR